MSEEPVIKPGDILLKIIYHHWARRVQRELKRYKVKKVTNRYVYFCNGHRIRKERIDNESADEWFTSYKKLYKSKLRKHKLLYGDVCKEMRYLERMVRKWGKT